MSTGVTAVRRVLIVGVSTRAAAASAARAGFEVTALDAYADLDQHPLVRALSMRRDFQRAPDARSIAGAAAALDADAVVYLSPFENHPEEVTALREGRALWGNGPAVLRAVRDPLTVTRTLLAQGFRAAAVRTTAGGAGGVTQRWMSKRLASGGGQGIRAALAGEMPADDRYLQEAIDGVPGSVLFVASPGSCLPLALSRQLIGDAAFGASGYRYCGTIIGVSEADGFASGSRLHARAALLAAAVSGAFGLTGLNGIDFVAHGDEPVLVEINPRWTGAMEVIDRMTDRPLFQLHADACARGELPSSGPVIGASGTAHGKAIVFARCPVRAPDTRDWLDDPDIHDVPHPDERFQAGDPVCTVFAHGDSAGACYAALAARAEQIYGRLRR